MANTQLSRLQGPPFVEAPEQDLAEVDGPDAVVDFLNGHATFPCAERLSYPTSHSSPTTGLAIAT